MAEVLRKCGMCGAETPLYRCKTCTNFGTRVYRAQLAMSEKDRVAWQEAQGMQEFDKGEFLARAKNLMPKELAALMVTTMKEFKSRTSEVKMVGTGEFLDRFDLEAKYKNKPLRLAAVLKNARTLYCTIAETTLYEDMRYTTEDSISSKSRVETEAEISAEEKRKKTAEAVKKVKREPSAAGATHPLTPKQEEQVTKWVETIKKSKEAMDKVSLDVMVPEMQQYLPSYMQSEVAAVNAQIDVVSGEMGHTLANKQTNNFAKLSSDFKGAVEAVKECKRKSNVQFNEARKMLKKTADNQ